MLHKQQLKWFLFTLSLAVYLSVHAQDKDHNHHNQHQHNATQPSEELVKPAFPDTILVDQDGNKHHFYSDLIKGKLVLMNSIYTSCEGSCPVQTAIFARTRQILGDRVGRDVQMISISLDPVTDTPERLKEFADKHGGAGAGWTFLTGSKQDVTEVLQAMDLFAAVPEQHTPIAAVGNEAAGIWMKVINLNAPRELASRIDYVKSLGEHKIK